MVWSVHYAQYVDGDPEWGCPRVFGADGTYWFFGDQNCGCPASWGRPWMPGHPRERIGSVLDWRWAL